MRLLVLHNAMVLPESHPESASERNNLLAVRAVAAELAESGCRVESLEVGHDLSVLVEALRSRRPDAVVNLYERMHDEPHSEARVATILERSGVAFTGSPGSALRAGRDKPRTKRLASRAGIEVPDGYVVDDVAQLEPTRGQTLMVKPALRDSSQGIDAGSVVTTDEHLKERVENLLGGYGAPVLVEQFIPGRELSVHVVETPGLAMLPPTELHFTADGPSIVTYNRKWSADEAPANTSPELEPELAAQLASIAGRAFYAIGCRDYASLDVRIRPDGVPVLLEVNPNPGLSPEGPFARALAEAGVSYQAFLTHLVRGAVGRLLLNAAG